MRLKIQLPAIAGQLRVADCEAEGIVTLPEQSFESFLRSPWQSPRWTAEHALLDEDGRRIYSGILILREGGLDGVFAYNRGSRFAYLPGAQAVVNSILHQAAEEIIQEGVENTNEGSWCYYFTELFEKMRLIVEPGNGTDQLLLAQLEQRPESANVVMTDEYFDVSFYPEYCRSFADECAPSPLADPEKAEEIAKKLTKYLALHDGSTELYQVLHNELRLSNPEIEAMGFDLRHRYEPDRARTSGSAMPKERRLDMENIDPKQPALLSQLEQFRKTHESRNEPSGWAIRLRDLLDLGLPDHDVYLVHASADVGWVPAADLPQLSERGKERFAEMLDAKVTDVRFGPYGTELVLDGIDPQLLTRYDEAAADCIRAESAMKYFM